MEIIPTILENTPHDAQAQIVRLSSFFNVFQIDVADGVFAPNRTPSVKEIDFPEIPSAAYDFHLMTRDYEQEIEDIKAQSNKITVRNILVHSALSPNYHLLSMTYPQFTYGAVLNSEDNILEAKSNYNIQTIPLIQFMTVHIGSQGNPFIEQVLKKIELLRKGGYRGKIFIDGSVNDETIPLIMSKEYRPNGLCVGSYITKTRSLEDSIAFLKEQIALGEKGL